MSLLLLAPDRDMSSWVQAIEGADPNIDVEVWPNVNDKKQVQFAVCWNQPDNILDKFPNLKAVSSLGAGADHLLSDGSLNNGVPICRIICPSLVRQMQDYVLQAVLNIQRNTLSYFRQKQEGLWAPHPNRIAKEIPIGILGLGKLGKPVAAFLADLDYTVLGWARTPKKIEGVDAYSGKEEIKSMLENTRILVCLLPLTDETSGILDLSLFRELDRPAWLINIARGEHLVEEDLIYALDKGWLNGAWLDVFTEEPLPGKHPFWNRKNIMITPHVCSLTPPDEAAKQVVENYKRAVSGMELLNQVDRKKGY